MPRRILVVDNEKDMVSVLAQRLKAYGYAVDSASNGEEAFRIIKKEDFDLIILDIMMPVLDGTALAQILRGDPRTNEIPIIFLTALQTKQGPAGYGKAGSDIVFAKPFDMKELASKIKETLGGRP